MTPKTEIIEWLKEQLANAEQSLQSRQQMEAALRRDPDELLKEILAMPGVIIGTGRKISKKAAEKKDRERLESADRCARIAVKNKRDVEMIKAVIASIS